MAEKVGLPLRRALRVLGAKWSLPILFKLGTPKRYGELKRDIQCITEKELIEKLRLLETNGFIVRTDFHETPPRVVYSLTELGKEASELFIVITSIGKRM